MRDIANTTMTNNKQILVKPVLHLSKCPRSRRCQYVNFIPQWGRGRQLQSGLLARKTIQNKYNSDVSVRIDQLAPPIRLEFVKMVEKFLKHLARDRVCWGTSSSSKELIVYDLEHNSLTFNLCITAYLKWQCCEPSLFMRLKTWQNQMEFQHWPALSWDWDWVIRADWRELRQKILRANINTSSCFELEMELGLSLAKR